VIAAPDFYAERLGPGFMAHAELLRERLPAPLARLAARPGALRGVLLGWLARRGHGLAVIRRERGTLPALLVCALPPARRRIFVLELIRRPLPRTAWRRMLYRVWWRGAENPGLRRGMRAAQVMTEWERDAYARHYGLDPARIHHVPWPLAEGGGRSPATIDPSRAVFSSGRTACDWPTLFAAAVGRGWDLVVACAARDAGEVRRLAGPVGARVEVEVAWDVHDALLREAQVCAIVLADRGLSAGHVRLMGAVEAGVAVVCTAVPALEGYAVGGETAELVPPADPQALGAAVDALLADPQRRETLREGARARAADWTYREYFARLRELIASGASATRSV
jgi:Glycosyl transferases group 1